MSKAKPISEAKLVAKIPPPDAVVGLKPSATQKVTDKITADQVSVTRTPATQTQQSSKSSAPEAASTAAATERPNKPLEAGQGHSSFGWLHRRPTVQALDGKLLTVHEIVRGSQDDIYGFYEADGSFVSLMHLEGPIDRLEAKFFPLALVGFAMGGALGLVAASLFNIRKHAIFSARQPSGKLKYVSVDSNGIDYLRRVVLTPVC